MRFAPSTTGKLNVGAARTALFNWLLARASGGSFVVRLDDTGQPGAEAGEEAVLRDLRWLGLDWDEGPDVGGATAPYRRSERSALHAAHV
ncbi:MAG TPA: glutamate--tRNA ligase family protein, partial [Xanthomonadales bacterium]|nr:glutamate--tRNA ligase family protein [Xanthomonadales bacterium]